mmetsp:Transcript_6839/g.11139  ORF Transcript_6839/g.11139 Transcript_6839/m.11139 type:complete len:92 (+) Transcript_6839:142-417(+)
MVMMMRLIWQVMPTTYYHYDWVISISTGVLFSLFVLSMPPTYYYYGGVFSISMGVLLSLSVVLRCCSNNLVSISPEKGGWNSVRFVPNGAF